MTSRKVALSASLALVAGSLLWSFAGCSLPTSGLPPVDGGTPCSASDQCDDMNQCTTDTCEGGFCVNAVVPDGDAAAQTPGDCHKIVCKGGTASTVADNNDVEDDGNSCTTDACTGGMPTHTNLPPDTACTFAGQMGTCDNTGTCKISCGMPGQPPCNDNNECTDDACNFGTHKCDFTPKPDGTPTPNSVPVPGDCRVHQCVGGVDTNAPDDTDLPSTSNDCVTPTCTMGNPTLPTKGAGTSCVTAGGHVCDGSGTCVPCNVDADCSGPSDECQHPACTNHTCGPAYTPANTPLASQTPGDCKVVVCNGNGGTQVNNDNNDTKDDGNPCTDDICSNGTLTHPPKAMGVSCGGTLVCDGSGSCVGCNVDADCKLAGQTCNPPGCGMAHTCACCPKTCAQLPTPGTCGNWPDGCGGMVGCNDNMKDGTETDIDCGGGGGCNVKCALGKKCKVASDCASNFCNPEGVCCDSACNSTCKSCLAAVKGGGNDGNCGNVKTGTDPNNNCTDQGQASCGTNGQCDGAGACQYYATGSVCLAASCKDVTTLNKDDTCTAAHTCMDNGTQGCGNYICANNACKTSCSSNNDCADMANYYCAVPNCVPKKGNGGTCNSGGECQSGNCIDGYCCNGTCGNTCEACNIPNNLGTCTAIPLNMTDPGCSGMYVCDGNRQCLLANGQSCSTNTDCASNNCSNPGGGKVCQP